jgi:hypothetical protein
VEAAAPGAATKVYCVGALHALFAIFPGQCLDAYKPSSHDGRSFDTDRLWCNSENQFYNWNRATGEASWCLPVELRNLSECKRHMRILCFACDEGSTG